MSFYEWLLVLHVLSAFALMAALLALWVVLLLALRASPAAGPVAGALVRPSTVLVQAGAVLALGFGAWLAIYVDGYELWDGWILASIVLWPVATVTGEVGDRALRPPDALQDPIARRNGVGLQVASTLATVAILVLMIYKPGA